MSVVRPGTSSDVRQAYLKIVVLQNDRDNSTMGMRPHANHEHNKQYNHNNPTGSKAALCTPPSTLQPAIVPKVDPPTTMGLTLGNTNDSPIDNNLCDPRAEGRIPPLILCFLTLTLTLNPNPNPNPKPFPILTLLTECPYRTHN